MHSDTVYIKKMRSLLHNSIANAAVAVVTIPIGILIGLHFWQPTAAIPSPAKLEYHADPAPRCGKGYQWQRTLGDEELWTLAGPDTRVIARVFRVNSFPGHWYVQTNSSTRVMESEWGKLYNAKLHAEDLAAGK